MREILGIKVYNVKEVRQPAELSTNTIHHINKGILPARKIAGYHVTEDNLKEYIQGERFTDPVTGQSLTKLNNGS